jgi:two-component system phosphate regulon sensor histidine kinase PhoR
MSRMRTPNLPYLLLGAAMLIAAAGIIAWRLPLWPELFASVLFGLAILSAGFGLRGMRLAQLHLRDMTMRVQEMAQGADDTAALEGGGDDIGALAESINELAVNMRERMDVANKERNQLLAILSSMVEGVIAVDRADRIVHLNEAAMRMLRLSAGDLIGSRIWDGIRNPQIIQPLQEVLRDGIPRNAEVLIAGRASDQVLELAAAPLRDGSGNLAGALAVLHDVTELRRLQGIRKDFVANVSHELKTPVTAIGGLVETLLDDHEMEPAQRVHFLERIHAQNDRMIALVRDLLTLSRIEADSYGLELERVDLRAVLQDSLRTLAPQASQHNLELVAQLPPEPLHVRSNDDAFRQIVDNLIDNAIKYTPEGGRIDVSLARERGQVECSITDTGVGIAEDEQERIFERFYRVDKARSREVGGTGLGLSIVKHLARAIGGDISLRSRPGAGSTFTLRLPASEA